MTPPPLITRRSVLIGGLAVLTGCTSRERVTSAPVDASTTPSITGGHLDEEFRPQYHYTAVRNQINDPNGLLWYDGEYHLFHQYNVGGEVHWGHAVSTDLLHWERLPPALRPDAIGQIWSGSAVVDEKNTSGFQSGHEKALVAVFTYSERGSGAQSQGLAYSNDRGRTWRKYAGNPILPNDGRRDFRDPKVFWHEGTQRWIMVVSVGTHLEFHSSTNLIEWAKVGEFGQGQGAHGGSWECPDLFGLPVEGTGEAKWVLSVSVIEGAPAGGSGMQYFVGDFDGATFTNENSPETVLWQNYGKDYYAGVTWGDKPAPDDRRLMIAWTDNWQYREYVPTAPFNGQLSLIRELRLRRFPEGDHLVQNPLPEYRGLRHRIGRWRDEKLTPGGNVLAGIGGETLEITAVFSLENASAQDFGIEVRAGGTQGTRIGYDRATGAMYVDRTKSGAVPEREGQRLESLWSGRYVAPLAPRDGTIMLRVFVDRSSVEVFGNEREQISCLILPDRTSTGLATFSHEGEVSVVELTVDRIEPT